MDAMVKLLEKKLADKSREIDGLRKELQEQSGTNWVLGQIIKCSSNLDSFENLMDTITDMLMGIMGLSACTIWIQDGDGYMTYSRSTSSGDQFIVELSRALPPYLMTIKSSVVFSVNNGKYPFIKSNNASSVLIVPLENFKRNQRMGLIIAENQFKDFFNQNRINFFDILAIQISIIAENAKIFERVSEISNKDTLTDCYNRKYLNKLMLDMNSQDSNYSLAIFDMDNFKGVNDTYGHEKGDELLIEVARLAKEYARKYRGEVIRYGGDEFIIILFMELEKAWNIFEEFRNNVTELPIIKAMEVSVTTTIGLASYPETVKDMNKVFVIADKALLKAKAEGKNKIKIGYQED